MPLKIVFHLGKSLRISFKIFRWSAFIIYSNICPKNNDQWCLVLVLLQPLILHVALCIYFNPFYMRDKRPTTSKIFSWNFFIWISFCNNTFHLNNDFTKPSNSWTFYWHLYFFVFIWDIIREVFICVVKKGCSIHILSLLV